MNRTIENGITPSSNGAHEHEALARREMPIGTSEQDAHAKTHAMLSVVLERLDAPSKAASDKSQTRDDGLLEKLLTAKVSGLIGLAGSAATVWPFLIGTILVLSRLLPYVPGLTARTLLSLLPFGALTAAAMAAILVGRTFKRKLARMRFLFAIGWLYSVVAVLYLFSVSLPFLRHNDFPSGFMVAVAWGCAYSTARWTARELGELRGLMRAEEERERSGSGDSPDLP